MQINSVGSVTGAVGTQELWIWEAGSPAPISLGVRGGGAGFLNERLAAQTSSDDVPGNPSGLIQWAGSPASTSYSVVDVREANFVQMAGNYWLASSVGGGYATWGQLPSGAVEWNASTGDPVVVIALQSDGSCVVGDADGYQVVRWADGSAYALPYGAIGTVMADDYVLYRDDAAGHVVLVDRAGVVQIQRLVGQSWPMKVRRINGTPWICYVHRGGDGRERTVLHPYDDATRGTIVSVGPTFGLDLRVIDNTVHMAWGLGSGEAFNDQPYTDHIVVHRVAVSSISDTTLGHLAVATTSGQGGASAGGSQQTAGPSSAAIAAASTARVFRIGSNDPSRGVGAGAISEVPPAYAAKYPHNNVLAATESGHLIEVDDTPGAERVHVFHRTGSHIEMQPNGTVKYKSTNLRQDVTIGDHEMIIQGDWTVVVDGGTKIRVHNGALEIQAEHGAAVNVTGELKVHADNITLNAKQKIALAAPFVDIGSPVYMSLPANIATLYGVPIPTVAGLKPPAFSPSLVAKLSSPISATGVMAAETLKFVKFGQSARASQEVLKSLMKDPRTGEPQLPEIPQPKELPLSSPGLYRDQTPAAARRRDRLFDSPDDIGNTESYTAHLSLCEELGDYRGLADAKMVPGQIFDSDTTVPGTEPPPPQTFSVASGAVAVTPGSKTLTGANTSFVDDVVAGQTLIIDGVRATVERVQNNTSIILTDPWTGPTHSV